MEQEKEPEETLAKREPTIIRESKPWHIGHHCTNSTQIQAQERQENVIVVFSGCNKIDSTDNSAFKSDTLQTRWVNVTQVNLQSNKTNTDSCKTNGQKRTIERLNCLSGVAGSKAINNQGEKVPV